MIPAVLKNLNKISKLTPEMFNEITDTEERDRLYFEIIERMKKQIEDLHLREAANQKQIQKLKGENTGIKEKIDVLDVELKSTEKAKELDTNYLLQQEETLARSKIKQKDNLEDPKIKRELKKYEESNKKLRAEASEMLAQFLGEKNPLESLKTEIDEVIKYSFLGVK